MRDSLFQLLNDLALERMRQEEVEGFSLKQEDRRTMGELARAAAAYALMASASSVPLALIQELCRERARSIFPVATFGEMADLPPRDGYVKACALLMAEIERIDRRDGRQSPLQRELDAYGRAREAADTFPPNRVLP